MDTYAFIELFRLLALVVLFGGVVFSLWREDLRGFWVFAALLALLHLTTITSEIREISSSINAVTNAISPSEISK